MDKRDIAAADVAWVLAFAAAGFALTYLTPIGGIIVMALVVLIVLDALLGGDGVLSGTFSVGVGKIAMRIWAPVDTSDSTARRVWLWRAPAIMTLAGWLVAWVQNGIARMP